MQVAQFITRRNLDQLEEDIISLASHINATEYEFLVLVREFDLRQGWKAYHMHSGMPLPSMPIHYTSVAA